MARLLYVDESYDDSHYFVVGVLGDGAGIAQAERRLEDVAQAALNLGYPGGITPELHGSPMMQGTQDWATVQIQDRIDLTDNALESLGLFQMDVFCRGIQMTHFRQRYGRTSPHPWAFRNLLERLNERLDRLDEYAVVIADQHSQQRTLKRDLREAQLYGTPGYRRQVLDRIRDTAHFVDSSESRMIQLADLVAYVRRRRARGTERDTRAELTMRRLYGRLTVAVPEPAGQFDTVWWPP